ncbi:MAG: hypothetical protein ACOZB3_01120 [Calditrichota bacterium]
MFLVDEENHIIHDMSCIKYECQIKNIPQDKRKKVFTLDAVKRMIDTNHRPQYNGCRWCMSEYHQFDMNAIFGR